MMGSVYFDRRFFSFIMLSSNFSSSIFIVVTLLLLLIFSTKFCISFIAFLAFGCIVFGVISMISLLSESPCSPIIFRITEGSKPRVAIIALFPMRLIYNMQLDNISLWSE